MTVIAVIHLFFADVEFEMVNPLNESSLFHFPVFKDRTVFFERKSKYSPELKCKMSPCRQNAVWHVSCGHFWRLFTYRIHPMFLSARPLLSEKGIENVILSRDETIIKINKREGQTCAVSRIINAVLRD